MRCQVRARSPRLRRAEALELRVESGSSENTSSRHPHQVKLKNSSDARRKSSSTGAVRQVWSKVVRPKCGPSWPDQARFDRGRTDSRQDVSARQNEMIWGESNSVQIWPKAGVGESVPLRETQVGQQGANVGPDSDEGLPTSSRSERAIREEIPRDGTWLYRGRPRWRAAASAQGRPRRGKQVCCESASATPHLEVQLRCGKRWCAEDPSGLVLVKLRSSCWAIPTLHSPEAEVPPPSSLEIFLRLPPIVGTSHEPAPRRRGFRFALPALLCLVVVGYLARTILLGLRLPGALGPILTGAALECLVPGGLGGGALLQDFAAGSLSQPLPRNCTQAP